MNNYLKRIAKTILSIDTKGLSKVKFAKTIYFVHKGLIKNNLIQSEELAFIRMPLGPVPVGFMEMTKDRDFSSSYESIGLSYDQQTFSLNTSINEDYFFGKEIKNLLKQFSGCSTSSLVKISHSDPSWLSHKNGEEYFISSEDLKNPLPSSTIFTVFSRPNAVVEKQKMQAQLLNGMIDDIVDETTSLEYPEK